MGQFVERSVSCFSPPCWFPVNQLVAFQKGGVTDLWKSSAKFPFGGILHVKILVHEHAREREIPLSRCVDAWDSWRDRNCCACALRTCFILIWLRHSADSFIPCFCIHFLIYGCGL